MKILEGKQAKGWTSEEQQVKTARRAKIYPHL